MVLNMHYLLSDLNIAFNPAAELRSPAWNYDQSAGEAELTSEELIIHGCMIRQRLQQQLSDLNFRILKLYFTRPGDIQSAMLSAMVDVSAIRPAVISAAKIRVLDDMRFVNICCLNECWNTDLFRTQQYGPMKRYAIGCRPELLSRRRRRISECMSMMRNLAVSMAVNVLSPSCDIEQNAS